MWICVGFVFATASPFQTSSGSVENIEDSGIVTPVSICNA